MWNPCIFIGSGFEYTLSGSDFAGYRVSINGNRISAIFKSVEEAHKQILHSFNIYMGRK